MEQLRAALLRYQPWNEQERQDRCELLRQLRTGRDITRRTCRDAHLTASAWVVSPDRRYVLMAHHDLYNTWAWLGGHADGSWDLLAVALREVQEESGLTARPVDPSPYSLEILTVDGHEKRGVYVPSHLHLNLTYLLEADPAAPLRTCPGENSAVAWFVREQAPAASDEVWMRTRIYQKLNDKLARPDRDGGAEV